jgi:hypothetical protein
MSRKSDEYILGIDPGKWECGWCLMHRFGHVQALGIARVPKGTLFEEAGPLLASQLPTMMDPAHKTELGEYGTCIVEYPMVYPGTKQKGKPADITAVAYNAGVLAGARTLFEHRITMVYPNEWKGTVPKLIHHRRLAKEVDRAAELMDEVAPAGMRHHVWDAVGLAHYQWKKVNA